MSEKDINLDNPRYDMSSYWNRVKHFAQLTNPLNVFASDQELTDAAVAVKTFMRKKVMPEGYNEEKLWRAKYLYNSAFHPDTDERMVRFGRMCAQVPANTLITGCMIIFHKSTAGVVFWQWFNQTFNAVVNYSNRSGDAAISQKHLALSYVCATGGALATALSLKALTKKMPPIWGRLVPFAAVCGANCINIPMMRNNELTNGTPVYLPNERKLGDSKIAAKQGIQKVIISRVVMALPGMVLTPILTEWAKSRGWFCRYPRAIIPFQMGCVGVLLLFATPMGCAIYDQIVEIPVKELEPELQKLAGRVETVHYNRGL